MSATLQSAELTRPNGATITVEVDDAKQEFTSSAELTVGERCTLELPGSTPQEIAIIGMHSTATAARRRYYFTSAG